jgi:hypothetical protein
VDRLADEADGGVRRHHKHGSLLDSGAPRPAETAAARARLADTLIGRQALLIVDTNEQVARLSAQLHADLGRLGRIDDQASVEPFVERSGVI